MSTCVGVACHLSKEDLEQAAREQMDQDDADQRVLGKPLGLKSPTAEQPARSSDELRLEHGCPRWRAKKPAKNSHCLIGSAKKQLADKQNVQK